MFERIIGFWLPVIAFTAAFISASLWGLLWIGWQFQNGSCLGLYRKNEPDKAYQRFFEQSQKCGENFGANDPQDLISSIVSVARLAEKKSEIALAAKFSALAVSVTRRCDVSFREKDAIFCAVSLARAGNYLDGKDLLVPLYEDDPNNLRLANALAKVYALGNLHDSAKSMIKENLAVAQQEYERSKKRTTRRLLMDTYDAASQVCESRGNLEEAENYLLQVCDLAEKKKDWKTAVPSKENLVTFYERNNKPFLALKAQKQIGELEEKKRKQEEEDTY